jgi:hypothetical protein
MIYQINIPQAAWDALTVKAASAGKSPDKYLDAHLAEYLEAIKAEVGADVNRRLHEKLGSMTVEEKLALATSLGV